MKRKSAWCPAAWSSRARGTRRPGFCTEVMNYYRLAGLRPPTQTARRRTRTKTRTSASHVFTLDEARAMVRRGEIIDLKTAWGLTLV